MSKNKWTNTSFLMIGYLSNINDVNVVNSSDSSVSELFGGDLAYLDITPESYKFCYKHDDKIYQKRIRIYVSTLLHNMGLTDSDIPDTSTKSDEQKKKQENIYNFFKNYLYVIQPSYQITHPISDKKNLYIDGFDGRIHPVSLKGNKLPYKILSPVPIFNVNNTYEYIKNRSDFIRALKQTHPLGRIDVPWPTYPNCYPNGVIWEDNDGTCSLFKNVNRQAVRPYYKYEILSKSSDEKRRVYSEEVAYSFVNNNPKLVEPVYYKKNWLKNQYVYKDIAFIKDSLLEHTDDIDEIDAVNNIQRYRFSDLANTALPLKDSSIGNFNPVHKTIQPQENEESSVASDSSEEPDSTTSSSDNIENSTSDSTSSSSSSNTNINHSESNNENESAETDEKQGDIDMNQNDTNAILGNSMNVAFIHKLMESALKQKDNPEFFKEEDLINFHTAMLSPGLVVLAGLSGTGKSSLINLYANALNIPEAQRKFIPVRPFWNDDSDLLGYVDTVHSIYQPADCGLVDTLVEAQAHPDKLYLITFDEMNLARVEYYFSQFLSVLERSEDKRYIYLYDKNLTSRLYNSHDYPYRIHVGDNVLFCGTINMDESTHKFTDKVLDRSNIIKLQLVNFNSDNEIIQHTRDVATDIDTLPDTINTTSFNKMRAGHRLSDDYKRSVKSLLWSLHQLLNHANSNLGIGRRILRQIFVYLSHIPQMTGDDNHHLSMRTAFDLQLAQRVFTKLRGSKQDVGKLIKLDDDGHVTDDNGTLWSKLVNSPLSDFTYSKRVLERKGGELENYGFTL